MMRCLGPGILGLLILLSSGLHASIFTDLRNATTYIHTPEERLPTGSQNPFGLRRTTKIQTRSLRYEVRRDGRQMFDILIAISPHRAKDFRGTKLHTIVKGPDVDENNVTILDDEFRFRQVQQTSNNRRDNAYFTWSVRRDDGHYATYHHVNTKTEKKRHEVSRFPSDGYSLQAMMYLLQQVPLNEASAYNFRLLVPVDRFYRVRASVVGKEEGQFADGRRIACYKMNLELRGLLGALFPSYTFWVSQSPPHILVQYHANKDRAYLHRPSGY